MFISIFSLLALSSATYPLKFTITQFSSSILVKYLTRETAVQFFSSAFINWFLGFNFNPYGSTFRPKSYLKCAEDRSIRSPGNIRYINSNGKSDGKSDRIY